MNRILPHPLISLAMLAVWLLLTRFALGHLILGSLIALLAGWAISLVTPPRPRIRRWSSVFKLVGMVFVDIIRSNIAVARVILAGPGYAKKSAGFVDIPLRMHDRNALASLAIILTATPGTAWVEFDPVSNHLLIHVLDLSDGTDWADVVRNRYEEALLEIFE